NSFVIMGETGKEIEFVKANISYEGKNYNLHSFVWNRIEQNKSETFSIVIPPVLRSNTKYDFEIITYRLITPLQKENLVKNVEDRVRFLLMNNIYFDGKNVVVNKPKEVYNKLNQLITESFKHFESKNFIPIQAPSSLVLEELKKQSDFRFGRFFKRTTQMERDDIAKEFVSEKVEHLVALIKSELAPFTNSQLVQHHRHVNVKSVETDKEPFTLPVNIGMYAWDKTASINNTSVHNINFTPGVGLTIPFNNKSQLISRSRMFDSFGFSAGVLLKPVVDNNGIEFLTPGVNLPVYTGLGFRVFKVARFNAGVLILGEKGNQGFDNLSVIPTAGLALELNLWMGIKK
ncbi:MAG TPA: hypothetical protein PKM93_08730, partial [Prolixibacteraceae bacterium]|nr:hypothetical protein [Prolixibacteraceae bacterium]